jgi:hypothetical protein
VKDDRKVWEYDGNPRDNFATYDNRDIQDGKPVRAKGLCRQLAIRKRFIVLFLGLLGCSFLLGHIWPDKYPHLTVPFIKSVVKHFLPVPDDDSGDSHHPGQTVPGARPERIVQKPQHHEYSRADIEEAKREVLLKQRIESNRQQVIEKVERDKPSVAVKDEEAVPIRYSYEIELYSGGRIYTDNALMSEDKVSFMDAGGLWVSIDKSEVRKMTRTRIAAGNP